MRQARTLPYPPPWQDAPTLALHLSISDGTIDNWIRQGILPPPRMIGGKRMWEWSEVERRLRGDDDTMLSEADLARRVHDVTRKIANG
jgi:predicted site-specific integrase-resolvase